MLKLMNKKQRTTTNKGFSLVELIVVIAIMAVLVAVLAPAMLRYVENSRKSTDAQTVAGVVNTAEAAIIDSNVGAGTYVIKIDKSGCSVTSPALSDNAESKKIDDAIGDAYATRPVLKSNTWKNDGIEISITVQASGATNTTYNSVNVTGDDSFASYTELPQTGGNGGDNDNDNSDDSDNDGN